MTDKIKTLSVDFFRYYPDRVFRRILVARGFESLYVSTVIARHHVYRYRGKGILPPLVILHGGADSAGTYLPILLRLRNHFQEIIAVEFAGHGLSDEPSSTYTFAAHYQSINEVLDSLIDPTEPAIIAGNSLGGLTAMHYAVHAPNRVRGLFLLSPMGAPMTKAMLEDLYDAFTPKDVTAAAAFAKRVHHHISKAKYHLIARLTFAWITRHAIQDLVHATTVNDGITAADLHKLKLPIYMICGQSDRIMTPNALDFFRQNLPAAEITTPLKLGHCPHLENPKFVADKLRAFAERLMQQ